MSDSEETRKLTLAPAEAAGLLRELAAKLEDGTLKVGAEEATPQGQLKIKVSGKSKEGAASLALKLQWKYAASVEAATPSPVNKKVKAPQKKEGKAPEKDKLPSYKSIKKRLSSTFKKIRAQLKEGALPDVELAELFDGDAGLMLHYPKKGDAAGITAFRNIAASFASAVKAGDLEAAGREAAALAAAEKSCHKQYK